jgi:hypothetical protein
MEKKLPKDTVVSHYFRYRGETFERMWLPDERILYQIVHHWEDGKIMKYGFGYEDGIVRTGINPLHIVGVYEVELLDCSLHKELDKFMDIYFKSDYTSVKN